MRSRQTPDATRQTPQQIRLQPNRRQLVLVYGQAEYLLSAEYLRVHSPSGEVRGHGKKQGKLQTGKADVSITNLQPVGNYALKITFSDGHDSGLYDWGYLYELAVGYATIWADYLRRVKETGASRQSQPDPEQKGTTCQG